MYEYYSSKPFDITLIMQNGFEVPRDIEWKLIDEETKRQIHG